MLKRDEKGEEVSVTLPLTNSFAQPNEGETPETNPERAPLSSPKGKHNKGVRNESTAEDCLSR